MLPLRQRVLRPGRPPETAYYAGDELPTTRHFAAFDGDTLVGCATFMVSTWEGEPAWQLRGMATDASVQGRGVGRTLLAAATAALTAESGVPLFWCNARTTALGFYERQGWRVTSAEFVIEGIGPHVKMTFRT